jgi:hypothetical protein
VGESTKQPFQLSFNASLKIDFQGSRVTSDGGLILVRELDERLGFGDLIQQHLTDSRRGKNTQFAFADLLRQSVYSRQAGYEDLNDAERLSQDPTFGLIGSEKIWDRGAALTSRLQSFETEMLAQDENFAGLSRLNRALIGSCRQLVETAGILSRDKSHELHPFRHHLLSRNPIAGGTSTPGLDSLQVTVRGTLVTQIEDLSRQVAFPETFRSVFRFQPRKAPTLHGFRARRESNGSVDCSSPHW